MSSVRMNIWRYANQKPSLFFNLNPAIALVLVGSWFVAMLFFIAHCLILSKMIVLAAIIFCIGSYLVETKFERSFSAVKRQLIRFFVRHKFIIKPSGRII